MIIFYIPAIVFLFFLALFFVYIFYCAKFIIATFPDEPLWFNVLRNAIKIAMLLSIAFVFYALFFFFSYNPDESPFYKNEFGETNLYRNFWDSDKDIERLLTLIKEGADVNNQDLAGNTPLHYQMNYFDRMLPSQILVDNGANLNIQNHKRKTPIHLLIVDIDDSLCQHGIEYSINRIKEGLRFIASNNFDANITDDNGTSVFDTIISSKAIKLCLEAVHEITINDGSLAVLTYAYNSSGELIYCKDSTGKTVYSMENPEESTSAPTEFNTIDDLRRAIHQNNYTIEYQLLGFESLPKSEPIYKKLEDRPKPLWIERLLSPILYDSTL